MSLWPVHKSRTLKLKAAKWNSALINVIIYDISSPFKSVQWVKYADFDLSSNYKVDSAQSINYGRAVVFAQINYVFLVYVSVYFKQE